MLWLLFALLAATFWGMSYAMTEQLMKHVSLPGVLLACGLGMSATALAWGCWKDTLGRDWQAVRAGGDPLLLFAACVIVLVIAEIFILLSVKNSNATTAALVEISYPLVTAFFAWLFFREMQLTAGMAAGAALVFGGVVVIYLADKTF